LNEFLALSHSDILYGDSSQSPKLSICIPPAPLRFDNPISLTFNKDYILYESLLARHSVMMLATSTERIDKHILNANSYFRIYKLGKTSIDTNVRTLRQGQVQYTILWSVAGHLADTLALKNPS
jgi:hypothetical protein